MNYPEIIKRHLDDGLSAALDAVDELRTKALSYYELRAGYEYIKHLFSAETLAEIPVYVTRLVQRLINRISLVYMVPPIRTYDKKEMPSWWANNISHKYDEQLKAAERTTNLLNLIAIIPQSFDNQIELEIFVYFRVFFDVEDPKKAIGIVLQGQWQL